MTTLTFDDLVGLDLEHPRRRRLHEQLAGIPIPAPCGAPAACSASSCRYPRCVTAALLPSGLSVFRRLPEPEPPTHVRTRMAAEIARAVAASGNVTRDELIAAGFTAAEIATHFTAARRAARVDRMVAA